MKIINTHKIVHLFSVVWLSCFVYVLMEWLFFTTKPSILSYYTFFEKVSVIFLSPLIIFFALLPLVLLVYCIELLVLRWKALKLSFLIPALIYAAVIFLLVDNFTNTLFGIYSGTFTGVGRYLYALLLIALTLTLFGKLNGSDTSEENNNWRNWQSYTVIVFVLIGLGFSFRINISADNSKQQESFSTRENLPNILILSSDGINSRNMSAYGYERETTPFIASILEDSLVSDNHFSNAANTSGSVISLLTGKLPTTTGLIYPPDTLNEDDAYEHLPGILQKLGYTNADISIRHYADTLDLNLLDGFHYVNGRSNLNALSNYFFSPVSRLFPEQGLFLKQSFERISSRLFHVTGFQDIENSYEIVTAPEQFGDGVDDLRLQELYQFIDNNEQPFFMHVHLMGTHGPKFRPKFSNYSQGIEQTENHMVDFYDDAIRDFDNYVANVVSYLQNKELLDNTLLILNSDHGRRPTVGLPIPLILKFPANEFSGRIQVNTQRIDIAPTILDYLGETVPNWMEGQSLLSLNESRREIFVSSTASPEQNENEGFEVLNPSPPFYTLGSIFLLDCQRIYQLNLISQTFLLNEISGHTSPCSPQQLLDGNEVNEALLNHLKQRNYSIESLSWFKPQEAVDMELYLSADSATLINERLYIPAVDYLGKVYSVVLGSNEQNEYQLAVQFLSPVNLSSLVVFDESTSTISLTEVDNDGMKVNLDLRLTGDDPLTFQLTVK